MAFLISFVVIFLLMLVYYNTSGWVANIALILNLLFTVGILAGLGATLTAPGIAGLVLTIGMAVDTNVIIYERIKEELSKGKGYIPAINEGYKRSLPRSWMRISLHYLLPLSFSISVLDRLKDLLLLRSLVFFYPCSAVSLLVVGCLICLLTRKSTWSISPAFLAAFLNMLSSNSLNIVRSHM